MQPSEQAVEPSEAKAPTARAYPTSVAFSLVFVASFFACLASAIALNVLGNGTKLFPSSGFPFSSCMRSWKSREVERLATAGSPPEVLVMGSSRVMPLRREAIESLTGLRAFNLGVSVGCPVDFVAQLRFVLGRGVKPKVLIVGLDELAFGDNPEADHYDTQLLTQAGLFRELDLREKVPILVRALKTISVASTRESLTNLVRLQRRRWAGVPDETTVPRSEWEGIAEIDWASWSTEKRATHLTAGIDRLSTFWGKYLDRPDKLDGMRPSRRKLELFEQLMALADSHRIDVRVVLLPVHPEFERRTFGPRLALVRRELLAALAASQRVHRFKFLDATELSSFGGRPEAFEDGTHMTPENGNRLLEVLFPEAGH